jgi:hypothetical protein
MTAAQERHMGMLVFVLAYISITLCYWAYMELEVIVHLFDVTFN